MDIKQMFKDWMDRKKESIEFKNAVDQEILPIRRAAYLEEKKKTAIQEGKMIAEAEFKKQHDKKKQSNSSSPMAGYGLEDPLKFINKQEGKKNGS